MTTLKKVEFNLNNYDITPLPYSAEIEKVVLSSILEYLDIAFPIALKYLKAKGMFYDALNSELWQIICNCNKNGEANIKTIQGIYEGMRDKDKLYHFLDVANTIGDAANFENNCLLLNEFWIQRVIHRLGHFLNQNAVNRNIDALELLGVASESLDKIYRHISQMTEVTIKDGISELTKELYDISISPDGMLGLKSSIKGINNVIKGYRKGNLICVGGSTREGKTTLAIQEMRYCAENGIPVGYFSLEMKTSELALIMACDALNINTEAVLSGSLSLTHQSQLGSYLERIKKMPVKINDKPAIKIGEVKAISRMWVKNSGVKMIFIDHLHLMEGDVNYTNPEQKYTDLANSLKALAKELNIPVVALVQLHRKEKGNNKMHQISDIKYASGVEQAADIIMLIYRPELYEIETMPDGSTTKGFAKIHVGKLRLLPASDIKCHFNGLHFTDWNEWEYSNKGNTMPDKPYAGFQNYQSPLPKEREDLPF